MGLNAGKSLLGCLQQWRGESGRGNLRTFMLLKRTVSRPSWDARSVHVDKKQGCA